MRKNDAIAFWNAILAYGVAENGVGNVGNSGEFYTDREAREAGEHLEKEQNELIKVFVKRTGWKPVFVPGTKENDWKDSWRLDRAVK